MECAPGGPSSFDAINRTKPLTDRKLYRCVDIGPVSVLLIHDPSQHQPGSGELPVSTSAGSASDDASSAASLDRSESDTDVSGSSSEDGSLGDAGSSLNACVAWCIPAGSFDDPDDVQGLAHFCEHLVFMGSSAFPKENELDSFLSQHGGSTNAYTEYEYTVFQIEVECQGLSGALERLAACFASPLFAASAVERELEAIESEFGENLSNDDALRHLVFCDSALPGHPLARFAWGNKKSLVPDGGGAAASYGSPAPAAVERALGRLREWFDEFYRSLTSAAASRTSWGDEYDTQQLSERRMQLVVRANGSALLDGASDGGSKAERAAADSSQLLGAIEGVVRGALRPLTATWERALREQRQLERHKKKQARMQAKVGKRSTTDSPATPAPSGTSIHGSVDEGYLDPSVALQAALGTPCAVSWSDVCSAAARNASLGSVARRRSGRAPPCAANPLLVWLPKTLAAGDEASSAGVCLEGHPLVHLLVPVDPAHTLALAWALPPLQQWPLERPLSVLVHLLGHEARGSVLHGLRELGWASALEAGSSWDVGEDSNHACSFFRITITLTPQGIAAWKEVMGLVQSFIFYALCAGEHPFFDAAVVGSARDQRQAAAAVITSPIVGATESRPPVASSTSTKGSKKKAGGGPGPPQARSAGEILGMRTLGCVEPINAGAVRDLSLRPCPSLPLSAASMVALSVAAAALEPWQAESARIEAAEFDFSEDPDDPVDMCTRLSVALALGAGQTDVLRAWRRVSPLYCAPAVAVLLAHLHPSNMRIDISSPFATAVFEATCGDMSGHVLSPEKRVQVAGAAAMLESLSAIERSHVVLRTEPRASIQYSLFPVDAATLRAWRSPKRVPELFLPRRNPFVPSALRAVPLSDLGGEDGSVVQLSCNWASCTNMNASTGRVVPGVLGRLWHKRDTTFGVPRTVVEIFIHLPALSCTHSACSLSPTETRAATPSESPSFGLRSFIGGSPADPGTASRAADAAMAAGIYRSRGSSPCPTLTAMTVLGRIFVAAVADALTEIFYYAELAGLRAEIDLGRGGISIAVEGFSEHLPLLLQLIMRALCAEPGTYHRVDRSLGPEPDLKGGACPVYGLRKSMSRLLHSFRTECAMCDINTESRFAEDQALRVVALAVTADAPSVGDLEAAVVDASTAWTHWEGALEALLAGLAPDSSEAKDLLASLLGQWSGHGSCTESCCSPNGAALSDAAVPTSVSGVLQHMAPLWKTFCGETGARDGSSHPRARRPIVIETLVVGDLNAAAAGALHSIVTDHVAAAALRAAALTGAAPDMESPSSLHLAVAPAQPTAASFYAAASASNHVFALPPGCTLEVVVPSMSSREATTVVANVYVCPPVPLTESLPPPFNLSSQPSLYCQPSGVDAHDETLEALPRALGALSIAQQYGATIASMPRPHLSAALLQRVCADVIAHLTHEAAFNALRTQQQLGYSVSVSVDHGIESRSGAAGTVVSCVSTLQVVVQSSSHTAAEIDARISAFLASNRAALVAMGAGAEFLAPPACSEGLDDTLDSISTSISQGAPLSPFLRSVSSLIAQKAQPPECLRAEADRIWAQIRRGTYMFPPARAVVEAAALRALSLRDVLALYDTTFGVYLAFAADASRNATPHIAASGRDTADGKAPAGQMALQETADLESTAPSPENTGATVLLAELPAPAALTSAASTGKHEWCQNDALTSKLAVRIVGGSCAASAPGTASRT